MLKMILNTFKILKGVNMNSIIFEITTRDEDVQASVITSLGEYRGIEIIKTDIKFNDEVLTYYTVDLIFKVSTNDGYIIMKYDEKDKFPTLKSVINKIDEYIDAADEDDKLIGISY